MTWRDEFEESYDPPVEVTTLEGIEDLSWHNDVCPSFGRTWRDGEVWARCWVGHPAQTRRENDDPLRFLVQVLDDSGLVDVLHTDDVELAARRLVEAVVELNRAQRTPA